MVKGYKIFNPDWTCLGKKYCCPGTFEEDVDLQLCEKGMHFCEKLIDCFKYYAFNASNKVAEIVAYGNIIKSDDKCCTDKLEIVRELTWKEVLSIVNSGDCNSGRCNSGDCNSGNWNSGDCNSGDRNSGNRNSGDWNSGNRNSGDWNSGNRNSGNRNSGDRNSGNRNSGDWNSCDDSAGCFCTEAEKIRLFNKVSDLTMADWRRSRAFECLRMMPTNSLTWTDFESMSADEKIKNKSAEICGGYLSKNLMNKNARQEWWESLESEDKREILSIPNFDAAIFKEITGIDVLKGEKNEH